MDYTTGWMDQGSIPSSDKKDFNFSKNTQTSFAPHLFEGYCLMLGIKQPGHEADHSPPSSARFKYEV